MPYFRGFLAYNLKKLLSHSPSNWSRITTFHEIMKMAKFGTKNALFWYFWARIFKKLLSYLKSAPSNLSICKILRKTILSIFGHFRASVLKKSCHIWNRHPWICLIAKFSKKKKPKFGTKNALFHIWVFLG